MSLKAVEADSVICTPTQEIRCECREEERSCVSLSFPVFVYAFYVAIVRSVLWQAHLITRPYLVVFLCWSGENCCHCCYFIKKTPRPCDSSLLLLSPSARGGFCGGRLCAKAVSSNEGERNKMNGGRRRDGEKLRRGQQQSGHFRGAGVVKMSVWGSLQRKSSHHHHL